MGRCQFDCHLEFRTILGGHAEGRLCQSNSQDNKLNRSGSGGNYSSFSMNTGILVKKLTMKNCCHVHERLICIEISHCRRLS